MGKKKKISDCGLDNLPRVFPTCSEVLQKSMGEGIEWLDVKSMPDRFFSFSIHGFVPDQVETIDKNLTDIITLFSSQLKCLAHMFSQDNMISLPIFSYIPKEGLWLLKVAIKQKKGKIIGQL